MKVLVNSLKTNSKTDYTALINSLAGGLHLGNLTAEEMNEMLNEKYEKIPHLQETSSLEAKSSSS